MTAVALTSDTERAHGKQARVSSWGREESKRMEVDLYIVNG